MCRVTCPFVLESLQVLSAVGWQDPQFNRELAALGGAEE
jgi:hypothetical protein